VIADQKTTAGSWAAFLRFFKAMACNAMPVKYRLNVAVEIKRLQPPLRACLDLAVYL